MKTKLITLPNVITLANLLCGTLGIVTMVMPRFESLRISFILMLSAAVFDFLDGFVARLTKQYSQIGVQLDSLSDMVSFGVLPAMMALYMFYTSGGQGMWGLVIMLLPICSALRLAKFNVSEDQKSEFEGLPTPACALMIGSAGWYMAMRDFNFPEGTHWVILGAVVVLALLMVSPVRMFSLKFDGFAFVPNATRYVFLLMSLIIIIINGLAGIALVVLLYILTSLILWLIRPRKRV